MPTFRRKILLGYGACLGLVVVVLAWAIVLLLRLGRASDSILQENYRSILAAENMIDAVERQDSAVLLVLLSFKEQGLSEFRGNEAIFLQWLGRAKDNITIPGEKKIIEAIDRGYSKYLGEVSNLHLTSGSNHARAISIYHDLVLPSFRAVRDSCIRLRDLNHETMYAASNRAHKLAIQAVFSISIIGLAAVIIGVVFSLFLSRLISRPVTELKEAVFHIAQGDYEVQVPVRGTGELAVLADQFNLMAEKLRHYHAMNIDEIIAEKRKSEAIIQSVDDGLVVVDANLLVSAINPNAANIFGVRRDEYLGKHILEVVREEKLVDFIRQFSIVPRRSPAAEIEGVILILRDITRLHELDRLKSEFVMIASHELRTPLTSIGMSVDMLLESAVTKLTDQEKELLTVCHEEVQRLRALVNDLLDLSKIEAGKLELALEPVSPGFLCEQASAIMKSQAEAKNLQLTVEVPADLPDVLADPTKIEWVLVNLLGNAVRYTPEGGHIRLKGEGIGGQVHFSVSDDGEGVPYDMQSRIFDKFVRVKRAASPEGSGLGLAICKEIVRAHRGTIWLDSTPGQGSTFTFTLPLVNESIQRS
jgi:NtrC-family two-component system sensor histidine kinase KinB